MAIDEPTGFALPAERASDALAESDAERDYDGQQRDESEHGHLSDRSPFRESIAEFLSSKRESFEYGIGDSKDSLLRVLDAIASAILKAWDWFDSDAAFDAITPLIFGLAFVSLVTTAIELFKQWRS